MDNSKGLWPTENPNGNSPEPDKRVSTCGEFKFFNILYDEGCIAMVSTSVKNESPACGRFIPFTTKPPLGLMPRKLHEEKRLADLKSAMLRHIESKSAIPYEWVEELFDRMKIGVSGEASNE